LHINGLIRQYLLEIAHPKKNNDCDSSTFLEFEHILQLHNMALEPYQVHLLSYMKDPTNGYALKLVGLISFTATIVVVAVPEGLSLAMTLSLAFFIKNMMHDTSLFHHLIIALDCKGRKIKEYILHYEGTNACLTALLRSCFVNKKGSSQFNQWDPGGCSLVHQQHCLCLNLEDKVDFNGGVML